MSDYYFKRYKVVSFISNSTSTPFQPLYWQILYVYCKNRIKDAEHALCWLRGWVKVNDDIRKELDQIKKPSSSSRTDYRSYLNRTFYRPFLLVTICFFVGNFSGINTLSTFAVDIFASLGSPIDKYYATIMLGVAQIVGTILCACLIHYTGKRPIMIVSSLGVGLLFSSVAFYAHFYAKVFTLDGGKFVEEYFKDSKNIFSWVPLVGLVGGSLFAYIALRPIAWILIGEVFPTEIRAFASGLAGCVFYILGFAANKSFYSLLDLITLPGVYWMYASVAIISAVVFYFVLPETEGCTLLEIQEHFSGMRNLTKKRKHEELEKGEINFAYRSTE